MGETASDRVLDTTRSRENTCSEPQISLRLPPGAALASLASLQCQTPCTSGLLQYLLWKNSPKWKLSTAAEQDTGFIAFARIFKFLILWASFH